MAGKDGQAVSIWLQNIATKNNSYVGNGFM